MKFLLIAITFFVLLSAFLGFTTFTQGKVCGWKGDGKDWPCYCFGIESIQANPETGESVSTCNGFNLSCNEIFIKFYKKLSNNVELPASCAFP